MRIGETINGKWSREGGGRNGGVLDNGGVTGFLSSFPSYPTNMTVRCLAAVECFACLFDALRRPGAKDLFVIEEGSGRASGTRLDEQLPREDEARRMRLEEYTTLGKIFLWALVRGQPIPSDLASNVLITQLLGLDVIRGESGFQRLSMAELRIEAHASGYGFLLALDSGGTLRDVMGDELSDELSGHGNLRGEEALRCALGKLLIDSRTEITAAIRNGFTAGGSLTSSIVRPMSWLTYGERRALVSGQETVRGEDFLSRVVPHFSSVTGESLPPLRAPPTQAANFRLLCRLLVSDVLEPYLRDLLRFVTGCPSFSASASYMRINVFFREDLPAQFIPESHTCFQALYISSWPYTSEELIAVLIKAAEYCTTFGQQ